VSKNSASDVQHQASCVIRASARKKCLSGGKALWAKAMRAPQAPNRPAHAAIAIDDCDESREANHLRSGRRSSSNRRVARSSASASCVSASLRSRTTKLASESLTRKRFGGAAGRPRQTSIAGRQPGNFPDCMAARLSRGQRVHPCLQTVDRQNAARGSYRRVMRDASDEGSRRPCCRIADICICGSPAAARTSA
jgi:hypothetical protein